MIVAMRRVLESISTIIDVKTSALVGVSFFVSSTLNYSFQIVSGRYLGSEKYSLLAGLISVMSIATVGLSGFQIQTAKAIATGQTESPPKFADRQFFNVTKVAFFGALVLMSIAPFAARFWDVGIVPIILVCLYVFPAAWDSIAAGRFQGGKDFAGLAGYNFAQSAMKISCLLVVVTLGLGITSIIGLTVLSGVGVSLFGLRRTQFLGQSNIPGFDKETRRILCTSTLFWMILSIDVIIAHRALGSNAGNYAAASTICKALLWAPAIVIQVVFPHLSSRNLIEGGMISLIRKGTLATVIIAVSSAIVLSLVGPSMVELLYGESFNGAGQNLWKLCLAFIPFSVSQFLISVHFVNGHVRLMRVMFVLATLEAAALFLFGKDINSFSLIIGITGVTLSLALALFGESAKAFFNQAKLQGG